MKKAPHPVGCAACGRPAGAWATDRLTGLLDRWGWDEVAPAALADAGRDGHPVALLAIDIDRFKRINDRYGHVAGDAVLQAVAQRLRALTREGDLLGRYGGHGGDEFLVLLPGTGPQAAAGVAERIRAGVRALVVSTVTTNGRAVTVEKISASIGVCVREPDQDTDLMAMVIAADTALRTAKGSGRNRVRLSGRAMRTAEFRVRPVHLSLPAAAVAIAITVASAQPVSDRTAIDDARGQSTLAPQPHVALPAPQQPPPLPPALPVMPPVVPPPAPPPVTTTITRTVTPPPAQRTRQPEQRPAPPKRKKKAPAATPPPPPPPAAPPAAPPPAAAEPPPAQRRALSMCEVLRVVISRCREWQTAEPQEPVTSRRAKPRGRRGR